MPSAVNSITFKDRVFRAIVQVLQTDQLGLSPESGRIFRQKTYAAGAHCADISIELWPPTADHWSLLLVCQCTDDGEPITACDIAAFKTELDRIAGARKKGVAVSCGAVHESTLNYAQEHGLGIVRLLPDDQVDHMARRASAMTLEEATRHNTNNFHRALTTQDYVSRNRDFYAMADGYVFGSWDTLLKHLLCLQHT